MKLRRRRLPILIVIVFLLSILPQAAMASGMYWSNVNSGITGNHLDGIAWNGSLYVAVGTGGVVVTSPDGINWTKRNWGFPDHLYDVLWNGSKFLAAGEGVVISSSDGITWHSVLDIGGGGPVTGILKDIAWSGSCFVVVGDNGTVTVSPNGGAGSWTPATSGTGEKLEGVAWGGNKFVAVGTNGTVLTSPTGTTWTPRTSGTSEWLVDVEWTNGQFVAVGNNGAVIASPDGITWSAETTGSSEWLFDIAFSGRRHVAVGFNGTILDSEAGSGIWTAQSSHVTNLLTDVVWNGHQFIAVGTDGVILISSTVDRIFGSSRYGTAVNISKVSWPGGSSTVVLARGDNYADALAGVPLAYLNNAPILLTPPNSLDLTTKAEITRLGANDIIILGGSGAVSPKVEQELNNMGLNVSRIAGSNRYETAVKISQAHLTLSTAPIAVIAYGHNFPDALSAASYAAKDGFPILLVNNNSIPQETMNYINSSLITNTIVVGGSGVISNQVMNQLPNPVRISGHNRFSTSVELAKYFKPTSPQMYVATGMGFADAITGAVLAAKNSSGILLVGNNVSLDVQAYLANNPEGVTVFGGYGAVSPSVFKRIQEILQ